jgi:hypothetical protein
MSSVPTVRDVARVLGRSLDAHYASIQAPTHGSAALSVFLWKEKIPVAHSSRSSKDDNVSTTPQAKCGVSSTSSRIRISRTFATEQFSWRQTALVCSFLARKIRYASTCSSITETNTQRTRRRTAGPVSNVMRFSRSEPFGFGHARLTVPHTARMRSSQAIRNECGRRASVVVHLPWCVNATASHFECSQLFSGTKGGLELLSQRPCLHRR